MARQVLTKAIILICSIRRPVPEADILQAVSQQHHGAYRVLLSSLGGRFGGNTADCENSE